MIIRQIDENDLIIYMIFKLLHESIDFNIKDDLSNLIFEIYYKLDRIIFPYLKNKNCDAVFNYYAQIIYEEDE